MGIRMSEQDKKIDAAIRTYLRKQPTEPLPRDYDAYVDQQIWSAKQKVRHRKKCLRIAFYVGIVCLTAMSGLGVYAAAGYVQTRMQNMSEIEKDEYFDEVQTSEANRDHFSRELTENEKDRMAQLKIQYENEGRFPIDKVVRVDSEKDIVANRVCFEAGKSIFYLPEGEMSDEDLLEIIDFYYARDYSLANINPSRQSTRPYLKDERRRKLQKNARAGIERIFLVNLAEAKCSYTIGCYEDVRNKEITMIAFSFKTAEMQYDITLDVDTGKIYNIYDMNQNITDALEDVEVSDEKFDEVEKSAKDIVERCVQDESVHADSVMYELDESGRKIKGGMAEYCYDIGDGIVASKMDMKNDKCIALNYYTYQEFENMLNSMPELQQKFWK